MDLFTKLQPKGWLGKQGLIVPPSVRTAIAEPQGWLESMSLFRDVMRSDTPLPSIKGVLEGTKNLNDKVKNSALQLCETAYSINRSYNSKESNLLTKATKLEGKIKPTKTDSLTASSIELCSSMFLDLPGIKSGNHPGYNLGNIEFEMAQMEQANRSWLHSLLLEAEIADLLLLIVLTVNNKVIDISTDELEIRMESKRKKLSKFSNIFKDENE